MARLSYIFSLILLLLCSCGQKTQNNPEPDYNPHLLQAGKPIPIKGKVINMDSVAKPKIISINGRFVKAGKPKFVPLKSNFYPVENPKIVAGKGKVIDMDSVAPAKKHFVKGKKRTAGWPNWEPAPLAYNDNTIIAYLNVEQGLSSPFITSLLEDRYGRVWIGNINGILSVWDGKDLSHFTKKDGLNGNWISALLEDRAGRIWIGTQETGLNIWDGNQFTHYTETNGLLDNRVLSLMEDRTGRIWIGTHRGVSLWDRGNFIHFTKAQGLSGDRVNGLVEDREGRIWIGTHEGVNVWDPRGPDTKSSGGSADTKSSVGSADTKSSVTHFTKAQGLCDNRINCLLQDRAGRIWIGTGEGINVWDKGNLTYYTEAQGLSDNVVTSLLEDNQGKIWIGTGIGGINIWENTKGTKRFTRYSESEGLSNIGIWSLLEDRHGRVWIGTIGGGITIWDSSNAGQERNIAHYSTSEGLSYNNVWGLLADRAGRIWAGTQGGGVSVWDPSSPRKGFTHFTTTEGLSSNVVEGLMEDRFGRIWIGTRGGGACVWAGGGFTYFTQAEGLSSNIVQKFLEDRNGDIWMGTNGGLYVVKQKEGSLAANELDFIHYTTAEGLSNNRIASLLEDQEGRIWIGTKEGGVSVWDPTQGNTGGFTHYTTTEGLSGNHIFSLAEDSFGHIWMGTPGKGVNVLIPPRPDPDSNPGSSGDNTGNGGVLRHYTKEQGLSKNSIRSLLRGLNEDVWIGTYGGLDRLSWIAQEKRWGVQQFSKPDGLIGLSIYGMQIDQQDRLWLGTSEGLSRIDLKSLKADTIRPVLLLRNLQPFFDFVDWRQGKDSLETDIEFDSVLAYTNMPLNPVFPHSFNDLSFQWSGMHGPATQQLQYSYFLEGNDDGWSPLIKDNKVRFQNLSPGAYSFKVRAVGSNSLWSETATYSFTIRPPWWQTIWAYFLYAMLAAVSIWGFLKWRTGALRKRQKALEQSVLERTAEVVAQKNELEAQKEVIQKEKERSEELLLNILPTAVAKELMETGQTQPVRFEEVSILFADFKEFTNIVASIPPKRLIKELNDIFRQFDDIIMEEGLEKIKTVGDAYLAASGLPKEDPDHAIKCVRAAKRMIEFLNERNQQTGVKWKVRIGIHSGPITAGVVGKRKFAYDLFGDTINIASRVETASDEGRINVSAFTYDLIKETFPCEYRGKINAKGKGDLDMYFVK